MTDENPLEPLQQWPDDVSAERWRSERVIYGDPDLGSSGVLEGGAEYERGLAAMHAGDTRAAGKAFHAAADLGNPGAMREIGMAVFNALPPELKVPVSAGVFERAAASGDGRALCYMGLFRRLNDDRSRALDYYRAADRAGDPEGSRELGILLAKVGNRDARAALERSIQRGSVSGSLALGNYLLQHTSDTAGAERAFRVAADKGHPKGAMNAAGLCERRGDIEQAQRLRLRALENARKHRAFMESIQGPDYFTDLEREVEASLTRPRTSAAGAASGGSCMMAVLTVLVFALGVAGGLRSRASGSPRRRRGRRRTAAPGTRPPRP